MTGLRLLLAAAAIALATSSAVSGEIYKWTDSEGNIHFEDRPSGQSNVETLRIASRGTDNSAVQAQVQSRLEANAAAQQAKAEAAPGLSKRELRAEQAKRDEQCKMYRARLQTYAQSRRLYREDAAGERVYLDEKATQEARASVEKQVKEYCGA